ncbi:MAG TPA: hypothetical protein VF219_00120 [Vicinamibacterales bacterium]
MGVEDVCVEDVDGVDYEGSRNPRDIPDGQLSVSVVDSAETTHPERQRPRHDDGQQRSEQENGQQLA